MSTIICRERTSQASIVYGASLNERSRVLGVRVRGGGEPASRRESFKDIVTFPYKPAGARQSPYIKSNGRCTECAPTKFARVQSLRKTRNKKQGYRMVSYKLRGSTQFVAMQQTNNFACRLTPPPLARIAQLPLANLRFARVRRTA